MESMMFKHLRRTHFDVAFFVGLAVFATAYWYAKPRPVWQKVYHGKGDRPHERHTFLGYSADGQRFYSSQSSQTKPTIITWNTATGDVETEINLELPQFQDSSTKSSSGSAPIIGLLTDPDYLLAIQFSKEGVSRYSFFSIDGKQQGLSLSPKMGEMPIFLSAENTMEHPLALVIGASNQGKNPYLVDMITGQMEATFEPSPGQGFFNFVKIPGKKYVGLLWKTLQLPGRVGEPLGVDKQSKWTLDIISLQSHARVVRQDIAVGFQGFKIAPITETEWAITTYSRNGNSFWTKLEFFHFDPLNHTFDVNPSHPLHGMISEENSQLATMPPYLVTSFQDNQQHQNEAPFLLTIKGWLAKIGIQRNEMNTLHYRVADLATGQPLRQVSGLLWTLTSISPDARYVVGDHSGPNDEPGYEMYVIPHHLWEKALSWIQWLAWLLVIPWPLRYFLTSSGASLGPKYNSEAVCGGHHE